VDLSPETKAYLTECFESHLVEQDEPRDAWRMPDVRPAVSCGAGHDATDAAWAAIQKYPDLDMPYYWLSHFYGYHGSEYAKAIEVLNRGLKSARRKSYLAYEYGLIEYEHGNTESAVLWYIRACMLQISAGLASSYDPWLDLSDIAATLGVHDVAEHFRGINTWIQNGGSGGRSADGMDKMRRNLSQVDRPRVEAALKELSRRVWEV
jgi:hypothetical protein